MSEYQVAWPPPASVALLGQSGVRLRLPDGRGLYVDPYLTDHVYEAEGAADLHRLLPAPVAPGAITDAAVVLVSHHHLDHCDPTTLAPLLAASPDATVVCPFDCAATLAGAGVAARRVVVADEAGHTFGAAEVLPVPAAHPDIERDGRGRLRFCGYVVRLAGRTYYHAGDTSPHPELIAAVRRLGPIDVAFLPVNERNFYRDRRGIIGNMSIREAFALAVDIGAAHVVPIHWDMFAPNRVYPEEIEAVYRGDRFGFALHLHGEGL